MLRERASRARPGLPVEELLTASGDRSLRIPTRREVRSLNLSNAVAVAAYEALRQWGETGDASDASEAGLSPS